MLERIDRVLYWLAKALLVAGTCALILMAVHVITDVLGRLLFDSPVYATIEIVSFYYMVAAVCLPLAYIEYKDDHITVEILYTPLPLWARRVVFILSMAVTALFFGLFAYQSWHDSLRAMASREVLMGHAFIEIWPSRFFLPISFGLLVLISILRAIRAMVAPQVAEDHLRPISE